MGQYTQANRLLTIATPLGTDTLLLDRFHGDEALSQLFHYDLELLSENDRIAPKDILGKPVSWAVNHVHSEPRYWSGHVRGWVAGGTNARGLRSYRAEVVPWLWFLTRTTDCAASFSTRPRWTSSKSFSRSTISAITRSAPFRGLTRGATTACSTVGNRL